MAGAAATLARGPAAGGGLWQRQQRRRWLCAGAPGAAVRAPGAGGASPRWRAAYAAGPACLPRIPGCRRADRAVPGGAGRRRSAGRCTAGHRPGTGPARSPGRADRSTGRRAGTGVRPGRAQWHRCRSRQCAGRGTARAMHPAVHRGPRRPAHRRGTGAWWPIAAGHAGGGSRRLCRRQPPRRAARCPGPAPLAAATPPRHSQGRVRARAVRGRRTRWRRRDRAVRPGRPACRSRPGRRGHPRRACAGRAGAAARGDGPRGRGRGWAGTAAGGHRR